MDSATQGLVSRLIADTRLGKLKWTNSSVINEYRLEMSSGVLYLTFRNQDNSYALSFFQGISENRVLLSAKPGDLGYSELLGLQQAINDSFQATIDLIMSELNQIEA